MRTNDRTNDNINFEPHPTDIDRVRVTIECVECRCDHAFDMPEADFFKGMEQRRNGGLIQRCFPNLSPENREMFVSRICPPCFDAISHD